MHQRSVWLGPAGTRTPLHCDPYVNLLCQAWGAKAVRLHAPEHAAALAPYRQHALRNTSQARRRRALTFARFTCKVKRPLLAICSRPGV